jgi:transposase
MRDRNKDRTIERNYLRKWRFLIPEYEAVKAGRSEAFRWVGEFYRHHGTCSQTFRKYYNRYLANGTEDDLLPRRRGPKRRDPPSIEVKDAVFRILHSPPLDFGFNRTTWKIADLKNALKKENYPLSRRAIGTIIKKAGYRWLKAKEVLTSRDPDYRAKLDDVKRILGELAIDEGFFSIDEYGPFAVKHRQELKLVAPGEIATVPRWQRSKGFLVITAALELSTNQVTHFYSEKKNTNEVIRLLEILLEKNRHLSRLYLSWDAASWHMSKRLTERIAAHNAMAYVTGSTRVDVAPLPAGAQFLNVIESIFSGVARAIIHNSDYKSTDDAKAAIDRYFAERNEHFHMHPQRAGNRIWGRERHAPTFSESNNHKDPKYR